jgi:serine/threonine protein kinase
MPVGNLTVLDGRYVLDDIVGRGGMADVYAATDRLLERRVAVKVMRDTSLGEHRHRFVDEARTLAALNHPGLVTLLDAGFSGDQPYLVMELADGLTLSRAIAEGPLDPATVARIGAALAAALSYAHAAGVVHRDVKPGNVLLPDDGRVLLADFGIARLVGSTEHHTKTGDAIGSPAYLAPEQVAGEPLTPAVDVFSLGLVLLEALTGRRAFSGTPVEAAVARLNAPPAIPLSVGRDWTRLLTAMTSRVAAERPSAEEVARHLEEWRPDPVVDDEGTRVLERRELDATGVLRPSPSSSYDGEQSRPDRILMSLIATAAVVFAIAIALLVAKPAHPAANRVTPVPAGVARNLQRPLGDLHRAIEQAP